VSLGCVPVVCSENLDKKFTKTQIKTCIVVLREFEITFSDCLVTGQDANKEKLPDKDRKEWCALVLHIRDIYSSLGFVLEDRWNYHFKK
jgi:hypothetical protein